MDLNLHQYQKNLINILARGQKKALFLDMGMGKTPMTLWYIKWLIGKGRVKKVLVVAPLRVASVTWPQEVEKWDQFSDLKIVSCCGLEKKRLAAFKQDANIYTINRENCVWLVKNIDLTDFDMLVIDELSSFKSVNWTYVTNSQGKKVGFVGSQRFIALSQVRDKFKYHIGLTGTPIPNTYLELWPQLFLLDGGKTLGANFYRFRNQYFKENSYLMTWDLKPGAGEKIMEKVEGIAVSLKAEDYLQMPEKIYNDIEVDLDLKELSRYKEMEEKWLDLETEISTENVLVKLQQMASGFLYNENQEAHITHDKMLLALDEILEFTPGNILVFVNFKAEASQILTRYNFARELKAPQDLIDWSNGKIKLAVTHPASTGHGLNLQSGGSIIVWFGPNWSSELTQQAEARLYRQGQNKTVVIHRIQVKNTIHARVMDVLAGKLTRHDLVMDRVKLRG